MSEILAGSTAVLVVEDNPLNSELVADLLEADGFRVHRAETAEEGLKMARELLPELILMDVNLPGMDGISATRILREDSTTRHLIVIGLTADVAGHHESPALEADFDGYLTKPIDIHTFVGSVKSFLAARK